MPELPDLENFKQYFKSTSLHKKIEDIKSTDRSLIYGAVFDDFKEELEGKSFADVSRRGKFLVAEVENSKKNVVFHFGMTGRLLYTKTEGDRDEEGSEDFAQVEFIFENGYELRWINNRKFGRIYLVENIDEIELLR